MPKYSLREERDKYNWLYDNGYPAGGDALHTVFTELGLDSFNNSSIIDFGCGRGTLSLKASGYSKYVGIDISDSVIKPLELEQRPRCSFFVGSLTDPVLEGDYDIGWCSDVVEHLDESVLDVCLRSMLRRCRRLYVLACCRTSRHLGPHHENLHLIVKDQQWWADRLAEVGHWRGGFTIGDSIGACLSRKNKPKTRKH